MPCSAGPVLLQASPDGACENGQSRCRRAWGDGDCRFGYFKVVGHVLWVSSKFVLTYQLLVFFNLFYIYNRNACHGCTACVSCPLTRGWRAFFLPSWLNNSFFKYFFLFFKTFYSKVSCNGSMCFTHLSNKQMIPGSIPRGDTNLLGHASGRASGIKIKYAVLPAVATPCE